MNICASSIRRALQEDGYAVGRGVFSPEEIIEMRRAVKLLFNARARPLNGGLCIGPVPPESDLARRLLNDRRLASLCGGELPHQMHIHADAVNEWHVDLGPPASTSVHIGTPAWMYKTGI